MGSEGRVGRSKLSPSAQLDVTELTFQIQSYTGRCNDECPPFSLKGVHLTNLPGSSLEPWNQEAHFDSCQLLSGVGSECNAGCRSLLVIGSVHHFAYLLPYSLKKPAAKVWMGGIHSGNIYCHPYRTGLIGDPSPQQISWVVQRAWPSQQEPSLQCPVYAAVKINSSTQTNCWTIQTRTCPRQVSFSFQQIRCNVVSAQGQCAPGIFSLCF